MSSWRRPQQHRHYAKANNNAYAHGIGSWLDTHGYRKAFTCWN